jgi:hypothetical protein
MQQYLNKYFYIKIVIIPNPTKEKKVTNFKEINESFFDNKLIAFDLIQVDEKNFEKIFIRALKSDLAYNYKIIPETELKIIYKTFLDLFSDSWLYTNYKGSFKTGYSWDPVTDYTFDLMICAIDENLIGIILVGSED